MSEPSLDAALQTLNEGNVHVLSPQLAGGIAFLLAAREPGRGWGPYPNVESDTYHSAIVIEALRRCAHDQCQGIISDVSLHFQQNMDAAQLRRVRPRQLAELLALTAADQDPGGEHLKRVVSAVKAAFGKSGTLESLATRDLAWSTIALVEAGFANDPLVARICDRLRNIQREEGTWPGSSGQDGAIIPTCWTILALHRRGGESDEAIDRGIRWLATNSDESKLSDTFVTAMILRALAAVDPAHPRVSLLVENLVTNARSDGGWSSDPREPSRVENTAIAVTALFESGETTYLPKRLALKAAAQLREILNRTDKERRALKESFDQKVLEHCGKVVEERNRLKEQHRSLGLEIRELQQAQIVEEDAFTQFHGRIMPPLARSSSAPRSWLMRALLVLSALGALIVTSLTSEALRGHPIVLISGVAVLVVALVLYFVVQRREMEATHELITEFESPNSPREIDFLRREFREMSEQWPADLREEFLYRLIEFVELPPDMAIRFAEDLAVRLRFSAHDMRRVLSWMSYVSRLAPIQRRRLFVQLQRSSR